VFSKPVTNVLVWYLCVGRRDRVAIDSIEMASGTARSSIVSMHDDAQSTKTHPLTTDISESDFSSTAMCVDESMIGRTQLRGVDATWQATLTTFTDQLREARIQVKQKKT
jgi:hypothetical protein